MSQSLIYILLLFALLLPMLGAIVLRLLGPRMSAPQFYGAAGAVFAVVLASVLLLAGSNVPNLQLGSLSILLPGSAPDDISAAVPAADLPLTNATLEEPTAELGPSPGAATASALAPTDAPTEAATSAPTARPTEAPSATPEPTLAPTTEPTAAPTTEPTAAPPPPSGPRRYTVKPGDTLRSIAEQFGISVKALLDANKLTAEQADSLRIGQELVIPSP